MDEVFLLKPLILNLEEKILAAKNIAKKGRSRSRSGVVPFRQPLRHFALQAARKPNQSLGMLGQKFLADARLVIKPEQRGFRRNLYQIAVAFFIFREHQQMVVGIAVRWGALDVVIVFLADVQLAAD